MCAQFRNHNNLAPVPSDGSTLADAPPRIGNMALVPVPTHQFVNDVDAAAREYESALDALREQRVVMEMMQEAMDRSIPATRLQADAATQTELTGSAGTLPLRDLVLCKLQIARMRQRRVLAQQSYASQMDVLQDEIEQLRSALEDVTPLGVAMVGVGREGGTVVAVAPAQR